MFCCCDLLKNSYLCLLNNTRCAWINPGMGVVICWKIRIFAYWTTPLAGYITVLCLLWFAEKFVSLLIEQHRKVIPIMWHLCCDLLKNSYLCLLNNTYPLFFHTDQRVVICWKIRIFAYWTTPKKRIYSCKICCDLLKNSYLCLLNNTATDRICVMSCVVICWKIRIFAYWTTPDSFFPKGTETLWFAEKFVSLLIEQHPSPLILAPWTRCDLLKNSYLCLLNNTHKRTSLQHHLVVICWKIRIFAYWTTPIHMRIRIPNLLWFAEKFVSLLIEQHLQQHL